MFKKLKMETTLDYSNMYTNSLDTTDIVNCYFSELNQVKGYSYIGQEYNYIDMYSNLSSLEYKANGVHDN